MAEQPFPRGWSCTRALKPLASVNPPPPSTQDTSDPRAMEQLMGSLDKDNDGELTFPEFWQLIGNLASKRGGFSQ